MTSQRHAKNGKKHGSGSRSHIKAEYEANYRTILNTGIEMPEQSDQGLHCLPFNLSLADARERLNDRQYRHWKANYSTSRTVYCNSLSAPVFIFMETLLLLIIFCLQDGVFHLKTTSFIHHNCYQKPTTS